LSVKKLTVKEQSFIERLRKNGILEDLDPQKLRQRCPNGAVVVYCGDGDRSPNFYLHLLFMLLHIQPDEPVTLREIFSKIAKQSLCFHSQAYNGGPLRLIPDIPIPAEYKIHGFLQRGLALSSKMKKQPSVILSNHYHCGLGELANLILPEQIWLIKVAKEKVVAYGHKPENVIPLFHLDENGEKMRTYFVNAETREEIYAHWE